LPVQLLIVYAVITMRRTHHDSAATDLALALRLLVRRIRSAVPSDAHDLSWTQMAVIKRLETGGRATTADLARAERMRPQSMGATIAALENMGLVERTPHATDGRQMHIELTARGTAMRKSAVDARRTWLAQAIAKLDATEQQHLPAVTALIKRLAEL
jgi:DNA-binding MarR family transcriptional regulator